MRLSEHRARTRSAIENLLGEVDQQEVSRDTRLRREGDVITVLRDDRPIIVWNPDGSCVLTRGDSRQAFRHRVDHLGPEGVTVILQDGEALVEDRRGQRLVASPGVGVRVNADGELVWYGTSLLDRLPSRGEGGITRAIEIMLLAGVPDREILAEVHRRFPQAATTSPGVRGVRSRLKRAGVFHPAT